MNARASKELDQEIAEKVFGWSDFWYGPAGEVYGHMPHAGIEDDRMGVEYYSSSLEAAFRLVDHLRQAGNYFSLIDNQAGFWVARFAPHATPSEGPARAAETAEEAICRAALALVDSGRWTPRDEPADAKKPPPGG